MRISPKISKLPRSPNNGGWGKARPPKGGCNYELSDTHLGEGAENILRDDKLLWRFIPNCSRIAFPLHKLLKKDVKFEWKPEQENVFQHLKAKLTSKPILQYPDFSKEFILATDASHAGLGAVLSQGPLGKDLPVSYASRSLSKAETSYTTSEKELLAIMWATRYF